MRTKPTRAAYLLFLSLLAGPACPAQHAELDELVVSAMQRGHLPSVAVGVVRGQELVYSKALGLADRSSGRKADVRTLYRVGSVTKVFTTTLMGLLGDEGLLGLDDPVASHLKGWKLPSSPGGAAAITLRHLAQHASGLPERPADVSRGESYFWVDYDGERLRRSLAKTELVCPVGADVHYSNLGLGLLGFVLGGVAGAPYERVLSERLLKPLGMNDSVVAPAAALGDRLATGYHSGEGGARAKPWELGCLAGCGGLVSNVTDLARFVSLQFRAGGASVTPVSGGSLSELHRPQRMLDGWRQAIGLGWILDRTDDLGVVHRHNGAMAGYRSHVGFSASEQVGVIVLANSGHVAKDNVVARLGRQLLRRAVARFAEPAPAMQGVVARVMREFRAKPADELFELFVPAFVERVGRAPIQEAFAGPARAHGRCVRRVSWKARGSRWRISTVLEFEDGHRATCVLEARPRAPHGLTYLTIR